MIPFILTFIVSGIIYNVLNLMLIIIEEYTKRDFTLKLSQYILALIFTATTSLFVLLDESAYKYMLLAIILVMTFELVVRHLNSKRIGLTWKNTYIISESIYSIVLIILYSIHAIEFFC